MLEPADLPGLLESAPETLEVEIGCGNGHFMVEYCRRHPGSLFVGVDIKKKRCVKAESKIRKADLANARVVHGLAEDVLPLLPDASVERFHLYFPDPWPKARHRRRRFLRHANLQHLHRKLKIGGSIHFATDFFDYYLHTKVLLLLHEGMRLSRQASDSSIVRSIFGQRFMEKGKPIYSLSAVKIKAILFRG